MGNMGSLACFLTGQVSRSSIEAGNHAECVNLRLKQAPWTRLAVWHASQQGVSHDVVCAHLKQATMQNVCSTSAYLRLKQAPMQSVCRTSAYLHLKQAMWARLAVCHAS